MGPRKRVDFVLGGSTLLLSLFGIVTLAGVSAPFALKNFGSSGAYFSHQFFYAILPGILLCGVCIFFPLEKLRRISSFLVLICFVALLLVFIPPFGVRLGGAARWLALGPFSFQPSEFLKLTFILYLAALLTTKSATKTIVQKRRVFIFLFATGLLGLVLVLQPDISTLGIIVASGFMMYFVAKTPLWHSFALVGIAAAVLVVLVKLAPYRMQRVLVFFDPSTDPMGIGYQVKQALIAVGSGGMFGQGLGMSVNQVRLLPAAISDAIFAAAAQEMGFVGAMFLLSIFFVFVWRGIYIAKRAQDEFMQLAAVGITSWIGLQAFVNMGAMMGLVPLTGIPLPFMSYGGSHVIAELAGVGVLLNISRHTS